MADLLGTVVEAHGGVERWNLLLPRSGRGYRCLARNPQLGWADSFSDWCRSRVCGPRQLRF